MSKFKKIILFLFFVGILTTNNSFAQERGEMHVIVLADTQDPKIGKSAERDMKNMIRESKKIASIIKMNYTPHIFPTHNINADEFFKMISELKIGSDDTVIFYYAGHGSRTEDKEGNPWPDIVLGSEENQEDIDFALIAERLFEKNPRLMLAITDSCNNFLEENDNAEEEENEDEEEEENEAKEELNDFNAKSSKIGNQENYESLFYYSKGLIMASGSVPGESSDSLSKGGLYTLAFLKSLREEMREEQTSWEMVMLKAQEKANEAEQNPQWIYLENISNFDQVLEQVRN